ncbi:MAG: glycosyltransferase family 39 protein [Acidobacteria bacterium]|nr:glycosyltransferase family 39 protein [Acidobacteriota bacterium]
MTPATNQSSLSAARAQQLSTKSAQRRYQLIVIAVAALIFLGFLFHAPALNDDVDSAHAAIGRTMLQSGDWVTAHLNGVKYLDKSPLLYWMIATSYSIFGVNDWAARLPVALGAILLCWVTARFGFWAFGEKDGFYSGLVLATCVGLFLFTRVQIPDVLLTLSITLSLWAFLRSLEPDEPRPVLWSVVMAVSLGTGLLLKSVIAVVAPAGAILFYLIATGQLFSRAGRRHLWQRLRPLSRAAIVLLIPLPWYLLATLRNPPYFDFTLTSGPGQYRGFFWNYFINEQLLRFLNRRYPRDYNTVPRLQFWLFNLVWLFPWSVYFPAVFKLKFRLDDRAGRVRLLALCWTLFVLLFFTFSTTQEYYSMPVYPALALLLGSALAAGGRWVRVGTRVAAALAAAGALTVATLLYIVRNTPTPGDIISALTENPEAYTLSLGHMQDLTLNSFAYFRTPLIVAAIALAIGAIGGWIYSNGRAWFALAVMMIIFSQATRMALRVMEPELSSRILAEALNQSPRGEMIVADEYYSFSSVFFYANRTGYLLNRVNNLEYGSNATGAPKVFLSEAELKTRWLGSERHYLLAASPAVARLQSVLGADSLYKIKESGDKFLFCNQRM